MFDRLRLPLFRLAAGDRSLTKKELWEYDWQKKHWVGMFRRPEVRQKVLEYWKRYRFLDEILECVRPSAATATLDVGCGVATVLHYLPGKRVGIDPLARLYRRIYRYPADLTILRAYAEELPFDEAQFDFVVCSNCIDHTREPARAIHEIRRVLRPDGWFLLTCEIFASDIGERNVAHPHAMTDEKLLALLAGFRSVRRWQSPWIGLQRYVRDRPPTGQIEQIELLKKDPTATGR